MRKKSHVSLARYLVESIGEQELTQHRKAFCLGSILPDCKPSFLTTKHEMQGTFQKVRSEIYRLSEGRDVANMRAYFRDLGQVIHYIADYFTFPHNVHYMGSLREHCRYEQYLKKNLRTYLSSGEADRGIQVGPELATPEAICQFIQRAHEAYVRCKTDVYQDCRQIVAMCRQVVEAVIQLFLRTPRAVAAA